MWITKQSSGFLNQITCRSRNEWDEEIESVCQKRPKQLQKALPRKSDSFVKEAITLEKRGGLPEKCVLCWWRDAEGRAAWSPLSSAWIPASFLFHGYQVTKTSSGVDFIGRLFEWLSLKKKRWQGQLLCHDELRKHSLWKPLGVCNNRSVAVPHRHSLSQSFPGVFLSMIGSVCWWGFTNSRLCETCRWLPSKNNAGSALGKGSWSGHLGGQAILPLKSGKAFDGWPFCTLHQWSSFRNLSGNGVFWQMWESRVFLY